MGSGFISTVGLAAVLAFGGVDGDTISMTLLQKANFHRKDAKDAKISRKIEKRNLVFLCVLCAFAVNF